MSKPFLFCPTVLGMIAALAWPTAPLAESPLRPDDPKAVELGARIYAEACASCHGAELEGEPDWRSPRADGSRPAPPHDATGHTWHHDGATLVALTKGGAAAVLGPDADVTWGMPLFDEVLTDEEIIAALSYIKSTWPEDIRAVHDEIEGRAGARP